MADNPYVELPLTQPREIRLLQVQASEDKTLHIRLFKVPLDRVPPFCALSYTWGSGADGTSWLNAIA
jgi:hypothetical protein